ncbi:MAG: ABC transporter substrate-binding protein [Desulfobacterales bacterium]|nr:ABC transporter substrate-binding protein [Desulfobacterales bacterium]
MKNISIFLIAPFLLFCYSAISAETRGVTKDTIKMGHITADTGPIAKDSQSITEGVRNYIRHINEQGGINGRKVELVSEDSGYSIPRAMSAFKKLLYKDMVFTFFGPTSTGEATALLSQIAKEKVVTVPITAAETMSKPLKRYVFGASLSYEAAIRILFDYVMEDLKSKNPKIAIVYPDVEFGKVGRTEARIQAKIYGVELHEEILNMGSLEATSQVLSMKKYNPDFVILHHVIAPASIFLREARKFGLKTNFLTTITDTNLDTVTMSKEAARGTVGVNCFRSWYEDVPAVKKMREITLRFHPGTDKPYRSEYYTAGWIIATIFSEGMKRAGRDLNNETLLQAMETIKEFGGGGLTGPISYSPTDHRGHVYGMLYKADVENGIVVSFGNWRKPLHP